MLYWDIGQAILANQKKKGWGAKVIDGLSVELQKEFPGLGGFGTRNLKYMRAFAEAWPDRSFVQQLVAQIPWGHNCVLLFKIQDYITRNFYLLKTLQNGWSRSVLEHHVETELHLREGQAPSNFKLTLPPHQSDLAQAFFKDPYVLTTSPLSEKANERALENALLFRLKDFLIELGTGFAFIGNQYRLQVDQDEFFLDLLFYHTRLHRYVVIDLKVEDFKPEFAGKMTFYQAAVDHQLKSPEDGPTIGLILCRGRNKTVVEYTLEESKRPIAVASYRRLPTEFKSALPSQSDLKHPRGEPRYPEEQ